jgi:hypothetical protein
MLDFHHITYFAVVHAWKYVDACKITCVEKSYLNRDVMFLFGFDVLFLVGTFLSLHWISGFHPIKGSYFD